MVGCQIKKFLTGMKSEVGRKLKQDLHVGDIHKIADMINSIEKIEAFIDAGHHQLDSGDDHQVGGYVPGKPWLLRTIEDELNAADKYYSKWQETGDDSYHHIGLQEIEHADALIHQAEIKHPEERAEVQALKHRSNALKTKYR